MSIATVWRWMHFTAQLHDAHALYGYAGVLEEYGEYSAPVR